MLGYVIAALVGLGLLAYVIATFVGVGDEPEQVAWGKIGHWLRGALNALDSASPLLLAVIWIGYGLLHLMTPVPSEPYASGHKLTSAELQVPEYMRSLLIPIWYGSGAFEVAMGLLVVQSAWRRWSLLAQLVMLVALTPFVVHILGSDAALTDLLPGLPPQVGRVVLVLHNLLLFVWIARVYRSEVRGCGAKGPVASKEATSGTATSTEQGKIQPAAIVALVMLAANVAGCWVIVAGPWSSGALYLWAMGSLATGALVGFLFGVPRWIAAKGKSTTAERTRHEPNTNIEMLSDWLTKMLVGVGLVELHELGPTLRRTSSVLASGLTLRPDRAVAPGEAQAFATGLVAYFLVAGVIQGFLLTRMFLTRAWNSDAQEHFD